MSDKKAKTRRIAGESYWKLNGLVEKYEDAVKALREAARAKARELKLYPDQPNFNTGQIVHPLDGTKVIGRMDMKVLDWYQKELAKVEAVQIEAREARKEIARRVDTFPDLIDAATGELTDEGVVKVDPDEAKVAGTVAGNLSD